MTGVWLLLLTDQLGDPAPMKTAQFSILGILGDLRRSHDVVVLRNDVQLSRPPAGPNRSLLEPLSVQRTNNSAGQLAVWPAVF